MRVCVVFEGQYYKETSFISGVYTSKKIAEKQARLDGFKHNARQDLFLNEKEMLYRKMEIQELIESVTEREEGKDGRQVFV